MEARKSLLFAACAVALSSAAWAQQKKTIPDGPPPTSKYVQEHAIDVGDVPGHQVRVYELHFVYPKDGMVIEGVQAKESTTYGMSDYTNWTGLFNTYAVYSMEDGSKIFVRGGGATQTGADGKRSYSFADRIVGGTGRFKGIRGQMRGKGERPAGATGVTESESSSEYWFEE
jgi:hypothetical protein